MPIERTGPADVIDAERAADVISPAYADLCARHVFSAGGGSGIGACPVDAFTALGARVSFNSLTAVRAHRLCEAVERRRGARPVVAACDVRDLAALETTLALSRRGRRRAAEVAASERPERSG